MVRLSHRAMIRTRKPSPPLMRFDPQMQDGEMAQLFIWDEIDEFWGIGARLVRDELRGVPSTMPLLVRINSIGGDYFEALTIMSLLRDRVGRVDTQIDGAAFSAAGFLAQMGTTRSIVEGGAIQVHNPWSRVMGNADELVAEAERLRALQTEAVSIYAKRVLKDEAAVQALMDGESGADGTFMMSADAVAQGFADEVIELVERPLEVGGDIDQLRTVPKGIKNSFAPGVPKLPLANPQEQLEAKGRLAQLGAGLKLARLVNGGVESRPE